MGREICFYSLLVKQLLYQHLFCQLKLNQTKEENLENTQSPLCLRCGMSVDLCRGPHLRHTGQIGALKLLAVS